MMKIHLILYKICRYIFFLKASNIFFLMLNIIFHLGQMKTHQKSQLYQNLKKDKKLYQEWNLVN